MRGEGNILYNPPVLRSKDKLRIKEGVFAKIPKRVFLLADDLVYFAEDANASIVSGSSHSRNSEKYRYFISRYIKADDLVCSGENVVVSANNESVLVQYLDHRDDTLPIATRLTPPGDPLALRIIDDKLYLWFKDDSNDVVLFSRDPYDSDGEWSKVKKVAHADQFSFFDKGGEALVLIEHPEAKDSYLISSPRGQMASVDEVDTRGLEKRVGQDDPFALIAPFDDQSYWSVLRDETEGASYFVLHNIRRGRVENKFPIKERNYEKVLSGNGHALLFSKDSLLLAREGSASLEEIDLEGKYDDIAFDGKTALCWSRSSKNYKKIIL
jgi:hypothetical protein